VNGYIRESTLESRTTNVLGQSTPSFFLSILMLRHLHLRNFHARNAIQIFALGHKKIH